MFSGRGGLAMTCIEEQGSLWIFDSTTSDWSMVSPTDSALPYPEARSYHALGSDGPGNLVSPSWLSREGRSFHIPSNRWTELSSAPEPARGGTFSRLRDGPAVSDAWFRRSDRTRWKH